MTIVWCIISMLCMHAFWLPSAPVLALERRCIDLAPLDISTPFPIATIAILQQHPSCTAEEVDIRELLHLLYIHRLDDLLVVVQHP